MISFDNSFKLFQNFRLVDVGDFLDVHIPRSSFVHLDETEKLDILKSFTLSLCQVIDYKKKLMMLCALNGNFQIYLKSLLNSSINIMEY